MEIPLKGILDIFELFTKNSLKPEHILLICLGLIFTRLSFDGILSKIQKTMLEWLKKTNNFEEEKIA